MVEFKLQSGHVGKAGRGGVHPDLYGGIKGGDASLWDDLEAVCSATGIGVGFDARGTHWVVSFQFEINGQSDVIVGVKPSIVADLGAVPAEPLRDAVAVERGHLVRFVAPAVVDALADHVLWLSNIGHHPGGGVGVGLRGWEGGDVVALARPLRGGRGGGGPPLVHAEGEIVVLVHG